MRVGACGRPAALACQFPFCSWLCGKLFWIITVRRMRRGHRVPSGFVHCGAEFRRLVLQHLECCLVIVLAHCPALRPACERAQSAIQPVFAGRRAGVTPIRRTKRWRRTAPRDAVGEFGRLRWGAVAHLDSLGPLRDRRFAACGSEQMASPASVVIGYRGCPASR